MIKINCITVTLNLKLPPPPQEDQTLVWECIFIQKFVYVGNMLSILTTPSQIKVSNTMHKRNNEITDIVKIGICTTVV